MGSLRRATAADIPFIMATERLPGYDVLVGCYEEDVHRANLADDNWLYLIGLDASGTPQGFAALQNRHDGDGSEFLRRFAVANAGRTRTTRAVICMSGVATTAPAMSTARLASTMWAPRRAFPTRAPWC